MASIIFLVVILGQFVTACVGGIPSNDSSSQFTPKEKILIKQLRERVKGDLTQPIMYEDGYLVRFLRARDHDLEEAERMIQQNLAWRQEENMDSIFQEDWTNWLENYPFSLNMYDRDGRRVLGSRIGKIDVRRLVLTGKQKLLDRYLTYGFERALYGAQQGLKKTGFIDGYLLMNMAGYSAKKHACLACVPSWINLVVNYERYYPQLCAKIWVVNTPRIFQTLFELMKPSFSSHTARVLELHDYNNADWGRKLLKTFSEDVLTPEFGGKGRTLFAKSIHNQDIRQIIYYNNQTLH